MELKLRAKSRDGYFQDKTFSVSVYPRRQAIPTGDNAVRQRVEIEGINITDRLQDNGVVFQNSLDLVRWNKYKVAECSIPLQNDARLFSQRCA